MTPINVTVHITDKRKKKVAYTKKIHMSHVPRSGDTLAWGIDIIVDVETVIWHILTDEVTLVTVPDRRCRRIEEMMVRQGWKRFDNQGKEW